MTKLSMSSIKKFGNWRVVVAGSGGFPKDEVIFPRLVHGGNIVSASECISGETAADGIVISQPNVKVGVGTADCVPLVIMSSEKGLVLHVSRKSILRGLLDNVPAFIPPADISHIFIGPHICSEHFTFDWEGEEISQFKKIFPEAVEKDDTIHLSLSKAVQSYIDRWDVSEKIVSWDGRCTFEDEQLNSYRRWLKEGKNGMRNRRTATILFGAK